MTVFVHINTYLQDTIITLFWLVLIADVLCLVLNVRLRSRIVFLITSVAKVVASMLIVSSLLSAYYAKINSLVVGSYIEWISNIPVFAVWLFLIIDAGLSAYAITMLYRRNKRLSARSIKESLDELPTGLCFYSKSGQPLLANIVMNEDCIEITGYALLNANELWNTLSVGKAVDGCTIIKNGDTPIIRMANGKVKSFLRTDLSYYGKTIYELSSSDVTEEYALSEELNKKNDELKKMNDRLRTYGEQITSFTKEKEVLAAKIRIHDEIGKLLISSQRSLDDKSGRKELLNEWRQTASLFGVVMKTEERETDALADIIQTAKILGVTVNYFGVRPAVGRIEERILNNAIHECLTNTIVHAKGDELYVKVVETESGYVAELKNNGICPKTEVVEGGGLSSLRTLVEKHAGEMCITSTPIFVLAIEIPKIGGTHNG